MSIHPLITFKAGQCEVDSSSQPWKVKPLAQAGYIYLYVGEEDGMVHFCWRPRSVPMDEPSVDLIMIPGDGTFLPYTGKDLSATSENVTSPGNGRIFVLKFSSSSQRHLFWMQSKSQHPDGKPNWFSPRDLKIGQIVDMLLQGNEVDVMLEMEELEEDEQRRDDDGDEDMEDAPPSNPRLRSNSTGGAGAGATGGDVREEGEEAREGGADGGRAASMGAGTDASAIVQSFLNSLKPGNLAEASGRRGEQNPFTTLSDLLTPETCIPIITSAPLPLIDSLLSQLPPTILMQSQQPEESLSTQTPEPSRDAVEAAIQAMSPDQKKTLLIRVIRSPQLHQSLGSLTAALRDGGLPMVAQALNLNVENGGLVPGGRVPLGGGDAVQSFVDGVRRTVKKENRGEKKDQGDSSRMDTS